MQYSPLWDSDLYIHAGTLVKDITENPRYNDSIFPQDFAVKKNLPLYRIPTCTSNINDKKLFITEDPRYNDSICPQEFAVKQNLPLCRIPTCTSIINDKKLFITEDPRYNDSICPQNFAVKKILPLCRIPTCTSIINDKKPFPLIYSKKQMVWIFVRIASARRF